MTPELIHHLVVSDPPQVGGVDVTVLLADLDPAPAVAVALADVPDHARFGEIMDLGAVVRFYSNRARIAGLHHRCPLVAEHPHQHPSLGAVRVLDQPPGIVLLDDADREIAALIEPHAGIVAARTGVGHRLP